jgi:predicted CoA-binding protein
MPQPKTVAIIGASTDRSKFGNKSVRAHARQGWQVYPIHPKADEIEGYRAYRTLADVPGPVDRVSLYLPPDKGIKLLPEIAAAKPAEFFVNPGAESEALLREAQDHGLDPIQACSIVDLGETPADFDA